MNAAEPTWRGRLLVEALILLISITSAAIADQTEKVDEARQHLGRLARRLEELRLVEAGYSPAEAQARALGFDWQAAGELDRQAEFLEREADRREKLNAKLFSASEEAALAGISPQQRQLLELRSLGATAEDLAVFQENKALAEAADRNAEMLTRAQDLARSVRTPWEILNAEVADYLEMLDSAMLTQVEFTRLFAASVSRWGATLPAEGEAPAGGGYRQIDLGNVGIDAVRHSEGKGLDHLVMDADQALELLRRILANKGLAA